MSQCNCPDNPKDCYIPKSHISPKKHMSPKNHKNPKSDKSPKNHKNPKSDKSPKNHNSPENLKNPKNRNDAKNHKNRRSLKIVSPKTTSDDDDEDDHHRDVAGRKLKIKWGVAVIALAWSTIRKIVLLAYVLNGVCLFYALILIILSISTHSTVGYFLNMVTEGDGTKIPTILALSGVFSLPLNCCFIYVLRKTCGKCRKRTMNIMHFYLVVAALCWIFVLLCLVIFTISHAYSSLHRRVHNGIMDAMNSYKTDVDVKRKMDILQIKFQCCGSKSYNEWFDVPWFDTSLASTEADQKTRDDVPFSCCSRHTHFTCIHHDLMSVGTTYLYAPETNLSVTEHGCHPVLMRHTRAVAWRAALAVFFLAVLESGVAIIHRFLQTAHSEMFQYEKNSHWHTAWLIGRYTGKKGKMAPKPPPIPEDLMR